MRHKKLVSVLVLTALVCSIIVVVTTTNAERASSSTAKANSFEYTLNYGEIQLDFNIVNASYETYCENFNGSQSQYLQQLKDASANGVHLLIKNLNEREFIYTFGSGVESDSSSYQGLIFVTVTRIGNSFYFEAISNGVPYVAKYTP